MEQNKLKFKTTLNCGGCVSKVQEDFDNNKGVADWNVDTDNPDKILTIDSIGISEAEVVEIINKKGFKAEPIN